MTTFNIEILNMRTGLCVRELSGHTGYVQSITLVKPDILASASDDRTIRLWHWQTGGPSVRTLSGHHSYINTIEVVSPILLASGSGDKTIRFWDWTSGDCLHTLTGHLGSISVLKMVGHDLLG